MQKGNSNISRFCFICIFLKKEEEATYPNLEALISLVYQLLILLTAMLATLIVMMLITLINIYILSSFTKKKSVEINAPNSQISRTHHFPNHNKRTYELNVPWDILLIM